MPAQTINWRPILSGSLVADALNAATGVAEAILHRRNEILSKELPERASISAELALFYKYLADATLSPRYDSVATDFLEKAHAALAAAEVPPWLYDGLAGVAWVTVHLDSLRERAVNDDLYSDVDAAILDVVTQSPWSHPYDLIYGLVGLGVYLLERLPDVNASAGLIAIVDRLEETVERASAGLCWLTRPDWLNQGEREARPHGYYALGMAHGIAGLITFLASLMSRRVDCSRVKPLLEGSVSWLFSQERPTVNCENYPRYVGGAPAEGFFGWCWGDAGIATALMAAARALRVTEWESRATELALAAASRRGVRSRDSCLCHGAAGHAHVFNRLYHATNHPALKDAAVHWFKQTLKSRRPGGRTLAGFAYWLPGSKGEKEFLDVPGFLMGASGTALALLAASTARDPAWDRRLLLSTIYSDNATD